ncbi:hypothetical protein N431DRAFT_556990 [Stipitochalara longipes BDJ]|nr:hypothetical protein N431DRAFT_556990 [Stipitochalara longipes BDJ]
MTKKAAILLQKRGEESAKEKAQLRRKAQANVVREQEELGIILHNRKLRAQRKEKKRQGTLQRAQQKITWETATIQGLGNQALTNRVPDDSNEPSISQGNVSSSSDETESQESTKVKHIDIVVKSGETGTGFRIRRHLSGAEAEQPFPQRGSKKSKTAQPAQAGENSKSATVSHAILHLEPPPSRLPTPLQSYSIFCTQHKGSHLPAINRDIMRSHICPGIPHFLGPAASNCTRIPHRQRVDHVIVRSQRYSSTFRWTEDDASRIYIHGLGNVGMFIVNSLARQEARPPTTFLIPSNHHIEQFVARNGEVEIIEDDISYVCDGIDIEVVAGAHIYESSGQKTHQFKTLTLAKEAKFDTELEINKEDIYQNYEYRPHDYGDVTTFSGHHSAFNCAWDNQLKTVRSRPLSRRIDKSHVRALDRELAKNIQRPIKNLVIATAPESVVDVVLQLKDRLRSDSTILFVHMQKVVGVMEDLNKLVFQDPSNRPNYLVGLPYHAIWSKDQRSITRVTNTDIMSDLLFDYATSSYPGNHAYAVSHRSFGRLLMGPVIKDRPNESLEDVFLGATPLGTKIIDRDTSLFLRLRHTAVNSAVHTMGIMHDCFNGGVLQGSDRQAHVKRLLFEASRVLQADCPKLTYDFLQNNLGQYVFATANRISPMMASLVTGSTTSIEKGSPRAESLRRSRVSQYINGWIVKRGAELGIPCPENAAMVEYVKEATKEAIELKERIVKARAILRRKTDLALQLQEDEQETRINEEKKELAQIIRTYTRKEKKKRKAQLKTLESARPKPAFEKPAIMGLGNSALMSKADGATDGLVEEPVGKQKKKAEEFDVDTRMDQVKPFKPSL